MHRLQKIAATILCAYISLVVLTVITMLSFQQAGVLFLSSFLLGITLPGSILLLWLPSSNSLVGTISVLSIGALINLPIIFFLIRSKIGEGRPIPFRKMVSIVSTQFFSPMVGWVIALVIAIPISMYIDRNWDGLIFSPGMIALFYGGALGAFIGLWVGILISIQRMRG
jgi:hypothetical protein